MPSAITPPQEWYQKQLGPGGRPPSARKPLSKQDYGVYGSPWGNVPKGLENHLRSLTGINADDLREVEQLMVDEGLDWYDATRRVGIQGTPQSDAMKLVDQGGGKWLWEGWEDDPEYRAYKEGLGAQRAELARAKGDKQPALMPTLPTTGTYSQLEQLYAAHDAEPVTRPGRTEATRPGAEVLGDTPGLIGQQAAAQAQTRAKTALDRYYEEQGV